VSLEDYGLDDDFRARLAELGDSDLQPARVIRVDVGTYTLASADGERRAQVAGRLLHEAASLSDLPTVGDWIATDFQGRIVHVLRRRTILSRKAAGAPTLRQAIAANVDRLLIVSGLDGDFSLSRIERYVVLARRAGCDPVVVLNKADLREHPEEAADLVRAVAPGITVLVVSAATAQGWEALEAALVPRKTAVFAGSSGVGKTSLLNRLLGTQLRVTSEVRRSDERGRHATTYRELVVLGSGALLIDTPGMRELATWAEEGDELPGFADIDALSAGCRYRDCRHRGEPGCAVASAVERGELDPRRQASWEKQVAEDERLRARQDGLARRKERQLARTRRTFQRDHRKRKGGDP
jgi:ribosome biogenesis GTPase